RLQVAQQVRQPNSQSSVQVAQRQVQAARAQVERSERALRIALQGSELKPKPIPNSGGSSHPGRVTAAFAAASMIDSYFENDIRARKLSPAPLLDDAAFYRKASLDLVGTIPEVEDLRSFITDTTEDKRAKLVERLLADPRMPDYWALTYRSWILETAPVVGQGSDTVRLFEYLREMFAVDAPYDELVKDLLTAEGHNENDGAVSFPLLWEAKPPELATATSKLFLGVNLECAQCHDDTIHGWTQDDFWGLAAFFTGITSQFDNQPQDYPRRTKSRLATVQIPGGLKAIPGATGEKRALRWVSDLPVIIPHPTDPKLNRLTGPKPLGDEKMDSIPQGQRRAELAAWLARGDNPYFNRAIVNRIWQHFFGRGFAMAPDAFHPDEIIHHQELLDKLARDFSLNDRSLKHLMHAIAISSVYQLSSEKSPPARDDYSRASPRTLDPNQWFDSLLRATGMETRLEVVPPNAERSQELRWNRENANRKEGPVADVLFEMNSYFPQNWVSEGLTLKQVLALPPEEQLSELFWTVLSRAPTDKEIALFQPSLATGNRQQALEDILWVLFNSTEFLTY
ncbi:MAG: DUF1553 domain-containing protein, partial [Planctomycetota bacterium]